MFRHTSIVSPPPLMRSHSAWLEAIRGLACLAVLLYHTDLPSLNLQHSALLIASRVTSHGWLGIPVFFALSGYFIGGALERRATLGGGPLAFWRDRMLRIYPVFWAAFIFAGLLALTATPFNGLAPASAWPASPGAWLGDLTLSGVWFGIDPRLIVSWSLNYEIGFYLVAGLSLLLPRSRPVLRLSFFVAITTTAHLVPRGIAPLLDFWPQFAVGLAAALALSSNQPRIARFAVAAYPAALLAVGFLRGDVATSVAAALSLALIVLIPRECRLPAPPASLLLVGAASYSIYLVHVPVMSPLRNLALRFVAPDHPAQILVWLATIAAGLAAGFVFYRLVELPCERLRRPASPFPKTTRS